MNHSKITLAIAAIVAAAALATVAFAVPQQAMAHRHNNHHNNNHNGIKVDQQVNQQNQCNGQQPPERSPAALTNASAAQVLSSSPGSALCVNLGENNADIGH
jgi:uncharacterized protein HemX